jgi:hypothetical protein
MEVFSLDVSASELSAHSPIWVVGLLHIKLQEVMNSNAKVALTEGRKEAEPLSIINAACQLVKSRKVMGMMAKQIDSSSP